MKCPNCAGPISKTSSPTHAVCEFCSCRVVIAPEACAVEPLTTLAGETGHTCVECRVSLRVASIDKVALEACPSCYGMLYTREALRQVINKRRAGYRGPDVPPEAVDLATLRFPRNCPKCDNRMETHVYYGPGNSVIDSCHQCHLIWLDSGELAEIEKAPGRRQFAQQKPLPEMSPMSADAVFSRGLDHHLGGIFSLLAFD